MGKIPSWVQASGVEEPKEYQDFNDWFNNSGVIGTHEEERKSLGRKRRAVNESGEDVGRVRTSVGNFTQGLTSGVVGFPQVVAAGWQQLFEVGADLAYGNPLGTTTQDPLDTATNNYVFQLGEALRDEAESIDTNPEFNKHWAYGTTAQGLGSVAGMLLGSKGVPLPKGAMTRLTRKTQRRPASFQGEVFTKGRVIRGPLAGSPMLGRTMAPTKSIGPVQANWAMRNLTDDAVKFTGAAVGMTGMEGFYDARAEALKNARAEGRALTDEEIATSWEALAWNMPAGATEIVGAGAAGLKILKAIDKATNGSWGNAALAINRAGAKADMSVAGAVAKGAAVGAATEATQESFQNWWLNVGANTIVGYDEPRSNWQGAKEALIGGGVVGALMGGLGGAISRRAKLHESMTDMREKADIAEQSGSPKVAEELRKQAEVIEAEILSEINGPPVDLDFEDAFPQAGGKSSETVKWTKDADGNIVVDIDSTATEEQLNEAEQTLRRGATMAPGETLTYDLSDPNNPVLLNEAGVPLNIEAGAEPDQSPVIARLSRNGVSIQSVGVDLSEGSNSTILNTVVQQVEKAAATIGLDSNEITLRVTEGTGRGLHVDSSDHTVINVDTGYLRDVGKKLKRKGTSKWLSRAIDEEVRHVAIEDSMFQDFLEQGGQENDTTAFQTFREEKLQKVWDEMSDAERAEARKGRGSLADVETDTQLANEFIRKTWQKLTTGKVTEDWAKDKGTLREIIESIVRHFKNLTGYGENKAVKAQIDRVEKVLAKKQPKRTEPEAKAEPESKAEPKAEPKAKAEPEAKAESEVRYAPPRSSETETKAEPESGARYTPPRPRVSESAKYTPPKAPEAPAPKVYTPPAAIDPRSEAAQDAEQMGDEIDAVRDAEEAAEAEAEAEGDIATEEQVVNAILEVTEEASKWAMLTRKGDRKEAEIESVRATVQDGLLKAWREGEFNNLPLEGEGGVLNKMRGQAKRRRIDGLRAANKAADQLVGSSLDAPLPGSDGDASLGSLTADQTMAGADEQLDIQNAKRDEQMALEILAAKNPTMAAIKEDQLNFLPTEEEGRQRQTKKWTKEGAKKRIYRDKGLRIGRVKMDNALENLDAEWDAALTAAAQRRVWAADPLDANELAEYDASSDIQRDSITGSRTGIFGATEYPEMVGAGMGEARIPTNGADFTDIQRRLQSAIFQSVRIFGDSLENFYGIDRRKASGGTWALLNNRNAQLKPRKMADGTMVEPSPELINQLEKLREMLPSIPQDKFANLEPVGVGTEADVYLDRDNQAVYKVISAEQDGGLGRGAPVGTFTKETRPEFMPSYQQKREIGELHTFSDMADRFRIQNNHGGFVFTEMVGIVEGAGLVVKQRFINGKPGRLDDEVANAERAGIANMLPNKVEEKYGMPAETFIHLNGERAFAHGDLTGSGNIFIGEKDGQPYLIDVMSKELSQEEMALPEVQNSMLIAAAQASPEIDQGMRQYAADPIAPWNMTEDQFNKAEALGMGVSWLNAIKMPDGRILTSGRSEHGDMVDPETGDLAIDEGERGWVWKGLPKEEAYIGVPDVDAAKGSFWQAYKNLNQGTTQYAADPMDMEIDMSTSATAEQVAAVVSDEVALADDFSLWSRFKKLFKDGTLSVADTLESFGLGGLAKRLNDYPIMVGRIQAQLMTPFRNWRSGKKISVVTRAYKQVGEYLAIRENYGSTREVHQLIKQIDKENKRQGRRDKDDRDFTKLNSLNEQLKNMLGSMKAKAKADAEVYREANFDSESNELLKIIEDAGGMTGQIATRLGIKVKDGGIWRPMRDLGRSHYPRTFSEAVMGAIQNRKSNPELYAKLVHALQRDGVVDSDGEAADYLNSLIGIGDITGGEHMANMEKARGLRLPNEFYDTGVDNYLQFLTRFADRAAQVHSFGQTTDTDVDAFGAAIKAASGDKELRDYLQAVANELYRRRPIVTGMDRGFEYAVNLTGITYLSGMFTGVRDFMSGVMLANEQFGFLATAVPTLRAMKGSVKSIIGTLRKLEAKDYIDIDKNAETSEMVAAAEAIGAIREDFLQAQLIDQRLDPNRKIDRGIAAFGNKALFFKQSMDRLARAVTMGASLNWLRGARNQYAKNSNSWGSRKRVAALKRMRFTDEEAAAMLSGDRALDDEFARRSVAEKQYTYSIAQHPLFVGGKNPVYKLMFQFQRWTFQRGRDLLRNVVIPTANAFRKNQTFDPAPLLRFAGAGILFGELLKWLALFFTDKESRDPTLEEIVNSDDSAMKALERIKNNFVFTGATGFFGDYGMMIAEQTGLDRGPRWKDPFSPPLFNLTEDTIGAGRGFIEKGATLQALGQELDGFIRGIPPIQQGMGVVKGGPIRRAMGIQPFETYEARRDLIRTRVLARRYGKDTGLDVESRFQGVFKADKFSAGKTALKDALLTGDIEAAVEAKTDLLEKGLSLKSIKATVRSGQPVRIGMQTKDDVQKDFMRWMYKTNPSEVDRVQRVQGRYNYTARAIGL